MPTTANPLGEKALVFNPTKKQIAKLVNTALNLYSNPLTASMQETGSNCNDTITERNEVLGIAPTPYNISIEQQGEYIQVTFLDNGLGMTKQQFLDHYWKIGNSSKEKDANQTGKFGIGAKAVLSVSKSYTVATKSHSDGLTHAYNLKCVNQRFGEDMLPVFEYEEIEVADLQFAHGTITRFSVPMNAKSLKSIQDGLYQLALTGFELEVDDSIKNNYNWRFEMPSFEKVILGGVTYLHTTNSYYRGLAIVGNIPYPTDDFTPYWVNSCSLLPVLNNSDVKYNETRERFMRDFDDSSGNTALLQNIYSNLREAISTEFHSQKEVMDCSELEYYKYFLNRETPTISINGKDLDVSFTGKKLISEHKVWGKLLIEADFRINNLQDCFIKIPKINDRNFKIVRDNFNGFGKEKSYLGNIANVISQQPLIYNGRATQKTLGYYFDRYVGGNGLTYSTDEVAIVSDPIETILPSDIVQVGKIVTEWVDLRFGTEFDFMVKVLDQHFTELRSHCINCNELSEMATVAKYNFKKERDIQPTYSGTFNVYVGAGNYTTRKSFSTDEVESHPEQLLVYTIGRKTYFNQAIRQFEDLLTDYKKITKTDYKCNVKFIRFNATDMKKKALSQYISEAENIVTEDEFCNMICKEHSKLWKTVYRYSMRTNFATSMQNVRNQISYNNTTEIMFEVESENLKTLIEKMNLITEMNYRSYQKETFKPTTNFRAFDMDCFKTFKTAYDLVNEKKMQVVKDIENKVSEMKKLVEWFNFLYSKESFLLAKPILRAKGITFTKEREAEIMNRLR